MSDAIDMGSTIAPKSDQLNVDDLIAGPRTVTITRVTGNQGSLEQPVNVFFEGDNGKPYRPCKSMRRVMVAAWGVNAADYAGRSMTLYCDPNVTFGGMKVGGIRISHMSHIERDMQMALTASRAKRANYTVKRLTQPTKPAAEPAADWEGDGSGITYRIGERRYPTLNDWMPVAKKIMASARASAFLEAHADLLDAMEAAGGPDRYAAREIRMGEA